MNTELYHAAPRVAAHAAKEPENMHGLSSLRERLVLVATGDLVCAGLTDVRAAHPAWPLHPSPITGVLPDITARNGDRPILARVVTPDMLGSLATRDDWRALHAAAIALGGTLLIVVPRALRSAIDDEPQAAGCATVVWAY